MNDIIAFGVLDAAAQIGAGVPDDLWVIGYDDVKMAAWDLLDLTTLSQPVDDIAHAAVALLLQRLDDPTRSFEYRRFQPHLVVRGTAPD